MSKNKRKCKRHVHQKGKHQNLVDILYNTLKEKSYVTEIYKNVEYQFGEMDVLTKQELPYGPVWVYYEVKSNYNKQSYNKAKDQLLRWSNKWQHPLRGCLPTYGVYWSPTKVSRMVETRKYLKYNIK